MHHVFLDTSYDCQRQEDNPLSPKCQYTENAPNSTELAKSSIVKVRGGDEEANGDVKEL